MNLEKVAIVGATGYSGEELIRLLLRHPGVKPDLSLDHKTGGRRVRAHGGWCRVDSTR